MKHHKYSLLLALLTILPPVFGQSTKNADRPLIDSALNKISIMDCFNPKYYPESPKMVNWIKGISAYTMLVDNSLNVYDGKANKLFSLGTKKDFATEFATFISKSGNDKIKNCSLLGFPQLKWLKCFNPKAIMAYFQVNNHIFYVEFTTLQSTTKIGFDYLFSIDDDAVAQEFAEYPIYDNSTKMTIEPNLVYNKRLQAAWVSKENIFVTTNNKISQVTVDGGNGIVYGQSVHRNEFGINKGLFWAPNLSKLAFYRMDERRVKDYPHFSVTERPAKSQTFKYPMAGDSSHTVTIGVFDLATQSTIYLKTDGPYDQYLTNVTWSPDASSIYIAWVNREQNEMQLRQYDAKTGNLIKVHFTHKHEKYIEPENGPLFVPFSNTDFIWQSEMDGFNHAYLYKNGKLTQLTRGKWEITELLGFDSSKKYLIANTTMPYAMNQGQNEFQNEGPLNRNIIAIDWNSKDPKIKSISPSPTPGTYTSLDPNSIEQGFILASFQNINTPRIVFLVPMNQYLAKIQVDLSPIPIFESKNPLSAFTFGSIKIDKLSKSIVDANGTTKTIDLYSRTFYPPNFNPNKKYPVVVYLYGGPHAQMVTNTWLGGGNLWMHYMAQNGYIVYTIDNRGSSHRGLEFENATFRQLGTFEMEDQLFALAQLKRLSYVDSNRIGVHGWSFGGFLTTSLMTRHPGAYKVAVAGGPVIDWKYYEIMYTERYMDKPSENPEGYNANNLINHADKLKGRLLMIHGADDDVVVWQHSLMYVQKSVESMNANLDYYVYPGHKHNVIGPDRAHLYKKISQYFFDFL